MSSSFKSTGLFLLLLPAFLSCFAQTANDTRAKNWLAFQQLQYKDASAPWSLSAAEAHQLDSTQKASPLTVCTNVKQISCSGAILPVQQLKLEAKRLNAQQVQLHWETLGEYNSRWFVIERQTSVPNRFDSVGVLPAAGTSYGKLKYESIDVNAWQSNSYYRIKEADKDGRYTYSNVALVAGSSGKFEVRVTPNPASSRNLRFYFVTATTNQIISFTVMNSSGVMVMKKENLTVGTGYYAVSSREQLPPGSYFIKVRTNDNVYTQPFVIVN